MCNKSYTSCENSSQKKAIEMKRFIQHSTMCNSQITISQMPSEFLHKSDITLPKTINYAINFDREVQKTTYVYVLYACYKTFSSYYIKNFLNFPDIKVSEMALKFSSAMSIDPVKIFDCLDDRSNIEQIVILQLYPVVILYRRLSYKVVSLYSKLLSSSFSLPLAFINYSEE